MAYNFERFTNKSGRYGASKGYEGVFVSRKNILFTKSMSEKMEPIVHGTRVTIFYDKDSDAIGIMKSGEGSHKINKSGQTLINCGIGKEKSISGRYLFTKLETNGLYIFEKK